MVASECQEIRGAWGRKTCPSRPADGTSDRFRLTSRRATVSILVALSLVHSVFGQNQTIGLFQNDPGASEGYTLFTPLTYRFTYLIDNDGMLVNSWESEFPPGNTAYLLENGDLLRSADPGGNTVFVRGGDAGRIERFAWDGDLAWEFEYSSDVYRAHHDIEPLPNGNVLMIVWDLKTREEALNEGRDPALLDDDFLWPDRIIEVAPFGASGGNIVWEWRVWDHLIQDFDATKANYGIVSDHPELIDINAARDGDEDWLHTNSVDYNPELDQILVSVPWLNEFWVIDHSTTTEEAAGHTGGASGMGGDILYRWGNPQLYDLGDEADQRMYRQHDVRWIEAGLPGEGNIMYFNNRASDAPGSGEGSFSTVDEIVTPVNEQGVYDRSRGMPFGPSDALWRVGLDVNTRFFSPLQGSVQRFQSGNTLFVNTVGGRILEVDSAGEFVWQYVSPVSDNGPLAQGTDISNINNRVSRAYRYAPDYPGLLGRDLTPKGLIELSSTSSHVDDEVPRTVVLHPNYPNPFNPTTTIRFELKTATWLSLVVVDALGRVCAGIVRDGFFAAGSHSLRFDANGLPSGIYVVQLRTADGVLSRKMSLVR